MSVMKLFCFFALGVALGATVLAGEDLQQRIDAGGEPSVPTPEIEPGMGNGMELQFSIFPTYGFFLRHVDGVRFENVVIRPRNRKIRNLIRSQDASNLDLTGLKEL